MKDDESLSIEHRRFVENSALALGFTLKQLKGDDRSIAMCRARHIVAWLLRERFALSYPKLAVLLGRENHTTMLNSIDKVGRALLNQDGWATDALNAIEGARLRHAIPLESTLETLQRLQGDPPMEVAC